MGSKISFSVFFIWQVHPGFVTLPQSIFLSSPVDSRWTPTGLPIVFHMGVAKIRAVTSYHFEVAKFKSLTTRCRLRTLWYAQGSVHLIINEWNPLFAARSDWTQKPLITLSKNAAISDSRAGAILLSKGYDWCCTFLYQVAQRSTWFMTPHGAYPDIVKKDKWQQTLRSD